MHTTYDVVIVGAGPAGTTLARLLHRDLKVLLVDRKKWSDSEVNAERRWKSCGGLIAPDAQKALAQMGLGLPKRVMVEPQVFGVRAIDMDSGLSRGYQRHYINVNRAQLDRWLLSLVDGHVDVATETTFRGAVETAEGVAVTLSAGHSGDAATRTVYTKMLVGADGAQSRVRRQAFGVVPGLQSYVSVQHVFDSAPHAQGGYEMPFQFVSIFDRQVTDFYSWVIPKGDSVLVGTALPMCAPKQRMRLSALMDSLERSGYRFGRHLRTEGAVILRPRSGGAVCTDSGAVALVGEAAGLISPSSAEGISFALESGAVLAASINAYGHARLDASDIRRILMAYRRAVLPLRFKIGLKCLKVPIMYTPALRHSIMRSGILSMQMPEACTVSEALR